MSCVVGIAVAGFGVFWTIMAASMGAPGFFVLFGVVFVLIAIGGVVYNFHNATHKNRISTFDITTQNEESNPIAQAMGHAPHPSDTGQSGTGSPRKYEGGFCPFCGEKANSEFDYCPKCGKDI